MVSECLVEEVLILVSQFPGISLEGLGLVRTGLGHLKLEFDPPPLLQNSLRPLLVRHQTSTLRPPRLADVPPAGREELTSRRQREA